MAVRIIRIIPMDLTQRQQRILATIVKDYSEAANPVSSKELVEKYHFKESPATIRNEMGVLEKGGYIFQPHKSAGRVPTDKGYRFFINELMRRFELSEKERRALRAEILKLQAAHEQMGRCLSGLLSRISGQTAFALLPHETSVSGLSYLIGQPELEDAKTLKTFTELIDHLDAHAPKLLKGRISAPKTFVGGESPLPLPKNLSLMVSEVRMRGGKRGVIGILGPKRMAYAKNLSLLDYLTKLISGSLVIVLIIYYV